MHQTRAKRATSAWKTPLLAIAAVSIFTQPWDVVLGCDVVAPIFDSDALAQQLAAVINEGTVGYIAYEERKAACGAAFIASCEARQLVVSHGHL